MRCAQIRLRSTADLPRFLNRADPGSACDANDGEEPSMTSQAPRLSHRRPDVVRRDEAAGRAADRAGRIVRGALRDDRGGRRHARADRPRGVRPGAASSSRRCGGLRFAGDRPAVERMIADLFQAAPWLGWVALAPGPHRAGVPGDRGAGAGGDFCASGESSGCARPARTPWPSATTRRRKPWCADLLDLLWRRPEATRGRAAPDEPPRRNPRRRRPARPRRTGIPAPLDHQAPTPSRRGASKSRSSRRSARGRSSMSPS